MHPTPIFCALPVKSFSKVGRRVQKFSVGAQNLLWNRPMDALIPPNYWIENLLNKIVGQLEFTLLVRFSLKMCIFSTFNQTVVAEWSKTLVQIQTAISPLQTQVQFQLGAWIYGNAYEYFLNSGRNSNYSLIFGERELRQLVSHFSWFQMKNNWKTFNIKKGSKQPKKFLDSFWVGAAPKSWSKYTTVGTPIIHWYLERWRENV